MIDINKLRGAIAAAGHNQASVAANLGISSNTFSTKMKKGIFTSAEISEMIALLNIKEPMPIFFAEIVS